MRRRSYFVSQLQKDPATNRAFCSGKKMTDYPDALIEMFGRQSLLSEYLTKSYADNGLKFLIGYANFINQNMRRKSAPYFTRKFKVGEIITVDLFGSYGLNEFSFDHPAIVLKVLSKGLLIAPITSNLSTFSNANNLNYEVQLNARTFDEGSMSLNSTILLHQMRFISKARVIRIKDVQNPNTGKKECQRVTSITKLQEIKNTALHLVAHDLVKDMEKEIEDLKNDKLALETERDDLKEYVLNLEGLLSKLGHEAELQSIKIRN